MVPATQVKALLRARSDARSDSLCPVGGAGETVVGRQITGPPANTSFIRFNICLRSSRAAATSAPVVNWARPYRFPTSKLSRGFTRSSQSRALSQASRPCRTCCCPDHSISPPEDSRSLLVSPNRDDTKSTLGLRTSTTSGSASSKASSAMIRLWGRASGIWLCSNTAPTRAKVSGSRANQPMVS